MPCRTDPCTLLDSSNGYTIRVSVADVAMLSAFRWYVRKCGGGLYAVTTTRPAMYMHRLVTAAPKGLVAHHINGDTLDNRRSNLEVVTSRENSSTLRIKKGASQYVGVTWDGSHPSKPWRARIAVGGGRQQYVGRFATEEEAAEAYDLAALTLLGMHAPTNFPVARYACPIPPPPEEVPF